MNDTQGFLNSLFDFSFTSFITSKIIKVLYGLCIFFSALVALFIISFGFSISAGTGIVVLLIVAPLFFLIIVIYSRVLLEFIMVVFRISENIEKIAEQKSNLQ